MNDVRWVRLIGWPAIFLTAAILTASSSAAQKVGVTTATNPEATGVPPAAPKRVLQVGTGMFSQELVTTSSVGQTQLLFLDGSNLTIGANSEMKLDEFVYDPATGNGKLAVSMSVGVMRFVGGKLSKDKEVTVNTPSAVLGIRGGIALISVTRDGTATATLAFGKSLTITGPGGSVVITKPGFSSTITRNGPPSTPAPVAPAALSQINHQLEGHSGATGGAPTPPTDQQVSAAPLGTVLTQVSAAQQQQIQVAQQTAAAAQATAATTAQSTAVSSTTPIAAAVPAAQLAISTGVVNEATLAAANVLRIGPPIFGAYNVVNDPSLNSPIPFVINQNVTVGNLRTTPFFLVSTNGDFAAARLTPGAINSGYQAALAISGTGANQTAEILVATGETSTQSSATANDRARFFAGRTVGLTKFSRDGFIGLNGAFTSDTPASGITPFNDSTFPQSVSIPSNTTVFGTTFPSPTTTDSLLSNGTCCQATNFSFNNSLVQTTTPGIGASRTTQTLNGYAVGINANSSPNPAQASFNGLTLNSPPFYFVGSSLTDPTNVQVQTDASTSRVAATLNLVPFNTPSGSTFVAQYGSVTPASGTANFRTAFIDDSHFAAESAFIATPTANPQVAATVQLSTVNGQAPINTGGNLFVTATGIEPTTLLPPGASFCQCQFLQWGFFLTDFATQNGQQVDRVPFGVWAAGPQVSPASMPQSGTATYNGHAIGTVYTFNNFNVANGATVTSLAAGGFSNQWNFATRSGNLAISNFDGATYTGAASAANARDYTGSLSGAGRTVSVGGSFFGNAANPAAETGGQFRIVGAGYQAGGIFAGAK